MAQLIYLVVLERWNDKAETPDFEHEDIVSSAFKTFDDAVVAAFDCLKGGYDDYLPVAKDWELFKKQMMSRRVRYWTDNDGISHDITIQQIFLFD